MGWQRGQSYSQDLRDRVLDAGGAIREIAGRFGVSASFVSKVGTRLRREGERGARPRRGRPGLKLAVWETALRARVAREPDATLEELRAWLRRAHAVAVSIGCLWTTLERWGLRLKKSRSTPPSRTGRTSPRHVPRGARASRG